MRVLPVGIVLLSLAASPESPPPFRPARGEDWTFRGTVTEAIQRLDVRFRRKHDVEVRVFTLESKAEFADFAILTMLRRSDDLVSEALPAVSGTAERSETPPAVRLDLVRTFADGSAVLLLPDARLPLMLNDRTPVTTLPVVPLDAFASFEFGVVPPRGWSPTAEEFVTGERCVPVSQTRQSPNWTEPRGGQTAVQMTETAWLSPRDGTVRRVHRRIVQRDGFRTDAAVAIETKLEADAQTRILGREFETVRKEIEFAYAHSVELAAQLPLAVKLGSRPFEARLLIIDDYLRLNRASTPYREAVLAIRRRLDAARNGAAAPAAFPTHRLDAGGTGSPIRPAVVRATVAP